MLSMAWQAGRLLLAVEVGLVALHLFEFAGLSVSADTREDKEESVVWILRLSRVRHPPF
jgi:hypothetical protein